MTEDELLQRCHHVAGRTFLQLAHAIQRPIPDNPIHRKGWLGLALELALGTTAGNQALPDFTELGIELKTLPINHRGYPAESTFITSIPLLTIHQQTWHTSECYAKLKRVLWVPIEDDERIPFAQRRIGSAKLWSPDPAQEAQLAEDWSMLSFMLGTGRLMEVTAMLGEYLQVRPKGRNSQSLCYGFDEEGHKILTMPRGFYLRSRFTQMIL